VFCLIEGIPPVDKKIVFTCAIAAPIDVLATFLYVRALRISPLSQTVPLLSFTPAFLLLTSLFILGEWPSGPGAGGVLLIVAGSYLLNSSLEKKHGFTYPFRKIFSDKGSRMMLVVAFLYSITSNFGKMGVVFSSPLFFAASYYSCLSIILLLPALRNNSLKGLFTFRLLLIGACSLLMVMFHFTAIRLTYVSYMVAVKRTSLLFAILFGALFFKEKGLVQKIIGGGIMVIGIFVIALWG
jgi:uncharacterized membrane protein